VPERRAFEYAVVRVVPSIAREEFVNVGVVLFSRAAGVLGCQFATDNHRMRGLAGPEKLDVEAVAAHLRAMREVCAGDPAAGPIASLSQSERFHWLVAPRSTAIQVSAVHGGITDDPASTLRHLFQTLVAG
jgi:hypothetical protein